MEENKQVVAEWKATNQQRLSEIKSFNPELYSAINLALNYLNKSLTGEELLQEVEEVEVLTETPQKGFWRIMTEQEMVDKYGSINNIPKWNSKGKMDWIFGMPIKELIQDDLTEEQIGNKFRDNISILTDEKKDPNGRSWYIFPRYAVFDTSNVESQPTQRNLSGWRLVTEEELKKKKFGDLGIPEHIWKEIYGKPIEDFYDFDSEIAESIQQLNSNGNPKKFTKGIARGYNVTDNYFVYEYPAESQTTSTNEWRFKTLYEIQKEGLGFEGLSEKTISTYVGKKLKDLVDSVALDIYIKSIKNQEGKIVTLEGYTFSWKFFTDQPLPQETTTAFKLPIETLPATLKRDYIFTPNTGNRKAPSQSAGYLYSKYANLPAAQAELFSTFFKGNDGAWWKLKQVGTEWRWEKASPQPSQTATSTSGKNIDQMIKEAEEKFVSDRKISNLPPYLKQLAINNQIKEFGVVNENTRVNVAFSWSKSNEGNEFWKDVATGGFLTQKVLGVIGSKEKLFEMPSSQSAEQPKTETKQEWMPQDLVGKTLLFGSNGKKFRVEKFTRNNPKNKQYNLRDLTSPNTPLVTYNIGMSIIKKWLDGQSAGGVRIIEETPTGSDYWTWTQAQLNQKRKEISDAMIVFEKDDPEYKELKDQLDVIDAFID